MPFKCFNNNFYFSSKRYHTAAKQNATAFFDSSFNYIRQNSHLVSLESISNGPGGKYSNPHPANSTTTNYLQFDYNSGNNILVNDDENSTGNNNNNGSTTIVNEADRKHNRHQNPITFILPYQLDQVALALNKSSHQQKLTKISPVNISNALHSTTSHRFKPLEHKHQLHTSTSPLQKQVQISYESQLSASVSPTLFEEPKIKDDSPQQKFFQSPDINDIPEIELSDQTFLQQQINQILVANDTYQYEKIHSLYMAIKRNGIVPSRDIYSIVLDSISKRNIDDSTDDKLSTMLNVYQDLVQNKIKPNSTIYSIVITQLLNASIESYINPTSSGNGADFFKIAIDIFNASNCSQFQSFNNHILDSILIGMNFYPGVVNPAALMNFLNESTFTKTHIYYIAMINHCKFTKNSDDVISLYEDFKIQSNNNDLLNEKQFMVYSSFISTLVEIGELTLATKFLDKLLTSIKNYSEYDSKLNMLLTSYILSLSKINTSKAMEIWNQFNKIDWIPEFSYEFYSRLLNDVTTYTDGLKIYNYMIGLPKSQEIKPNLESILIKPRFIDSISRFIISAVQSNDKTHTLKAIKESFIRKTHFDFSVYPIIFQFLSNNELSTKIINSHGSNMSNELKFEFISYLTSIPNLHLDYNQIIETDFFHSLIDNYRLYESKNYLGLYTIFNNFIFIQEPNLKILELCSPLIVEFYDLDNYYTEIYHQETLVFKNQLTAYYTNLINHFQLNESSNVSQVTKEAIELMNQI